MSKGEVRKKAEETFDSVRELLSTVKKSVHAELTVGAPKLVNALDESIDKSTKALSDSLKVVDKRTRREQLELLKAYRSFLRKQADLIEARVKAIEKD